MSSENLVNVLTFLSLDQSGTFWIQLRPSLGSTQNFLLISVRVMSWLTSICDWEMTELTKSTQTSSDSSVFDIHSLSHIRKDV